MGHAACAAEFDEATLNSAERGVLQSDAKPGSRAEVVMAAAAPPPAAAAPRPADPPELQAWQRLLVGLLLLFLRHVGRGLPMGLPLLSLVRHAGRGLLVPLLQPLDRA